MKYSYSALLFIFLINSSVSLAVEPRNVPKVKATLDGYKEQLDCSIDSKADVYLCKKIGNEDILLKWTDVGFYAVSVDASGEFKSFIPKNVEAKGRILFKSSTSSLKFPNIAAGNFFQKIYGTESFFETSDNKRIQGSPEFEAIAQKILSQKDSLKKNFIDAFRTTDLTVDLKGGQKLKCQRGKSRPLTQEELKLEKAYGAILQCGAFKCDPVTVNGKQYQATMLYDSSPMATDNPTTVQLTENGKFGPEVEIGKISSSDGKHVFVNDKESPVPTLYDDYSKSIESFLPENLGKDSSKIAQLKNPRFQQATKANDTLCSDKTALAPLNEAKKNMLAKLSELELAELISVLEDGSLVGYYVDPIKAGIYGCLYNGVILDPTAQKNLSLIKKNFHPELQVKQTISMDKAKELFNKAKNMKDIAWKFKQDGCYARAHLMARRFEAEGVRVDKVWIKGDLSVPDADVNWNFHVAPVVYVNEGKGPLKKMVIDPSLFDKPVTVEEWDNRMKKNTAKGSTVTAFPFPENAALFERSAISFSSSDAYLPRDKVTMTEQDKMGMANLTMKQYKDLEQK